MLRVSFIVLLFLSAELQGQTADYNPDMQMGLKYLVQFRYKDLFKAIEEERLKNPENRVADFLEASAISIETFVNEGKLFYLNNEPSLDLLVERIEQLPKTEPYRGLFLGELYLARAALEIKFDNKAKGAYLFYKAYNLVKDNYKSFPDFSPNYIPWGVLQAGVGSLPANYKGLAQFFGFSGSIEYGMELISKGYYQSIIAKEYEFYKEFNAFVYAFIKLNITNDNQLDLDKLGVNVKENISLSYLQSLIYLNKGDAKSAYSLMRDLPRNEKYLNIPFLEYHTGKVAMIINPQQAKVHLESYLKLVKNGKYVKSTYRYLAWYYLLNEDTTSLKLMQDRVKTQGDLFTGADQQALKEAQRGFNKVLVKARLNFDAGKYSQVVDNLQASAFDTHCLKDWEKIEFYYRKGRALQELNSNQSALENYTKAIAILPQEKSYAYGNSLLQLALLYEHQGKQQQALFYFEKTLSIEDYPFYEGIHQKAKAGLTRLK